MSQTVEPTRVAFCITELDPGGAERAFVRLITGLDRSRWEPVVFCLAGPGPLAEDLRKANVSVTCLGARGLGDWSVLFRLAQQLRQTRPALLQTFLFHANLVGRIAGWRAGIQHIVSGIRVAEKRTRTHLWLDRWTNSLVDQNVCVSQAVADFSIREARLDPGKVTVIRNGVDADRFAAAEPADLTAWGVVTGDPVFVAVGRLDPQKGLRYLLEAMSAVRKKSPRSHLLLVGEGRARSQIEGWIGELQLESAVHLLGWRADVPELLKSASCLVLASLWEGMPNVVLEAMAAGLPVVATRVEGTTEAIEDGVSGVLVASGSAAELAAGMLRIVNSPTEAERMGRAGQERVRREFSWQTMVDRYEELYRQLLASE